MTTCRRVEKGIICTGVKGFPCPDMRRNAQQHLLQIKQYLRCSSRVPSSFGGLVLCSPGHISAAAVARLGIGE